MRGSQSLISYLAVFILFSLAVKLLGFTYFDNEELLAVVFIAYGGGTVFSSVGNNKRLSVVIGTAVFLIGIIFFLNSNFTILNSSSLILPSAIFIAGACCLMLFIDDTQNKAALRIALVFFIAGLIYTFVAGRLNLILFLGSFADILLKYWLVVLVMVIAIYLVTKKREGKE